MKNPCDECVIKINCTAVCEAKDNYKTLILNAITQTKSVMGQKYTYFQTHSSYIEMLKNTNEQEANIKNRATILKQGAQAF